MSKREKLIAKLKSKPKDFTYQELKTLMNLLGFYEWNNGKTSGSRVSFINKKKKIIIKLHKPHPNNILKKYQIDLIIDAIKNLK